MYTGDRRNPKPQLLLVNKLNYSSEKATINRAKIQVSAYTILIRLTCAVQLIICPQIKAAGEGTDQKTVLDTPKIFLVANDKIYMPADGFFATFLKNL